ncbi:restriction endonuclease subunit S [Mycoplasmopsis felis]|uniref:restriction endonuclease subunit S n=1 Tax=Mycoplasmopsis felis TaxID=33923 RepID=UPI002AFDFA2F|nr:restriction endonuclease subunit S [Mycoplasmopsis felis]WQQ04066.1 restriction endonuclease subunit S [Mycoplasmopsis felis]
MKKILVPRVRFKEFGEEWKEERFDNIFFNIQEKNKNRYSIKEYISVASNTWKKDVNIKNKQTLWNYSVFRVGDIAYEGHTNEAFPFGRFVINRIGTGIISNIFTVFRPKADLSLDFSQYWVNNNLVMIGLLKRSSKSGIMMNSLTLENVNEEKISLPKYSEQQKIGKLLDQISNLINLENSKLNKLKQLKETLLQKMFPEGNSKTPRIRFRGFNEEWEEEKLENIYSFASEGGTPDTNKDIYYKPGLFYFTKIEDMANKYIYNTKSKISELGLKNSSAWIIPKNNILFSNGATIGNVSINKVDLSTKQGIVGMIIKKKFNLEFIYYLLKSENFQSKVAEKITVGTIPTVAIFNLKKIELLLTTNSIEQQKIGDFFSKIDNLISHYNSKLNKLKQIKDALLQKMFI